MGSDILIRMPRAPRKSLARAYSRICPLPAVVTALKAIIPCETHRGGRKARRRRCVRFRPPPREDYGRRNTPPPHLVVYIYIQCVTARVARNAKVFLTRSACRLARARARFMCRIRSSRRLSLAGEAVISIAISIVVSCAARVVAARCSPRVRTVSNGSYRSRTTENGTRNEAKSLVQPSNRDLRDDF